VASKRASRSGGNSSVIVIAKFRSLLSMLSMLGYAARNSCNLHRIWVPRPAIRLGRGHQQLGRFNHIAAHDVDSGPEFVQIHLFRSAAGVGRHAAARPMQRRRASAGVVFSLVKLNHIRRKCHYRTWGRANPKPSSSGRAFPTTGRSSCVRNSPLSKCVQVIDANTQSVIVPYTSESKGVINALRVVRDPQGQFDLLRIGFLIPAADCLEQRQDRADTTHYWYQHEPGWQCQRRSESPARRADSSLVRREAPGALAARSAPGALWCRVDLVSGRGLR
jgi:hypothetical protein